MKIIPKSPHPPFDKGGQGGIFRHFKLLLEYDGTPYCGWQVQKKGLSIQGHLQETLKQLTGEKVNVIGSGRTDAGAHALGQVAHFRVTTSMPLEKMKTAMNALLLPSVVVKTLEEVSPDFHAQLKAKSKLYAYLILNDSTPSAFLHRYCWQLIHPLDWDAMHAVLEMLVGRHDFKSFQSVGTAVKSTIREVKWVGIQEINRKEKSPGRIGRKFRDFLPVADRRLYAILIEANGFLKQMVRNIVGTVVQVGQGRITPKEFKRIFEAKDRRQAGPAAPAKGLFLVEVKY